MLLAFAAGGCGAALASGRALLGALLTGLVERMEVGTAGRAGLWGTLRESPARYGGARCAGVGRPEGVAGCSPCI